MRTSDWSNGYCPYLNVDVSIQSQNGDTATYAYTVTYCTTAGGAVYTNGNGRAWSFTADGRTINSGSININGKTTFQVANGTFSVSKGKNGRNFDMGCSIYMDVSWNNVYAGTVTGSGQQWIDARKHLPHGNPTLSTIKTTAHYGEVLTLSFAKSDTQGNANFDHFELWQGKTKLYSGTDTSYKVTPSDVTGAVGGTATYTLKEVHEWYGDHPSTETSITIKVQSGVVTIYDENRVKHVGLVTMYDENRVKHYVLITAYDDQGIAHNVV